ncbi:hypothetical protein OIU74_000956 [Salix koriyanagi]|uniref:Uncharacterized protein n=1 Tax=Salix koriyanagi TaxID=2511006 RepID=A0A9Q0X0S0_9ROSI|nr:hypothetical protein OIU74_000956 [Salix koriyanagi]
MWKPTGGLTTLMKFFPPAYSVIANTIICDADIVLCDHRMYRAEFTGLESSQFPRNAGVIPGFYRQGNGPD